MQLPYNRVTWLVLTWAALAALGTAQGVARKQGAPRRVSVPSRPGLPSVRRAPGMGVQAANGSEPVPFQTPPVAVSLTPFAKIVAPGVPNLGVNILEEGGSITTNKGKPAGFSWLGANSIGVSGLPTWTPPDAALCAGNGYVVEVVNSGIFVYTANGTRLLMNTLPNFLGGSELWGGLLNGDAPSPSDPSCAWDPTTRRWLFVMFLTNGGAVPWYLVVSASQGEDPTGAWSHWAIDPNTPSPPPPSGLLPDFPQFNVYPGYILLTTNEFPVEGNEYYGSNLYVIPTTGGLLSTGTTFEFYIYPRLGVFENCTAASGGDWNTVNANLGSYHVWPAALPTVGPSEAAGDVGVMYLAELSLFLDLQVWTLKGAPAAVAGGGAAALSLELACLPIKDYVPNPTLASQKAGECPGLGIDAGASSVLGAALADGGRDLHVLVNAGVERKGAPDPDTGAWWLRVAVGRGGGEKAPKVKKQRLLAAPDAGDSLLYAALGLDAKGKQGLVVFTVTGANHYPSPGFSVIRGGKPRKDVYIVAEGVAEACDGNQRWGDYHTVRMDEEGNFYGSVEWIASNASEALSFFWATRISKFSPEDLKKW